MTAWRSLNSFRGNNRSWAVVLVADSDPGERAMQYSSIARRFSDPLTGISYSLADTRLLAWRPAESATFRSTVEPNAGRPNVRAITLLAVSFAVGGLIGFSIALRTGDIGDIALSAAFFGLLAIGFVHLAQTYARRRLH